MPERKTSFDLMSKMVMITLVIAALAVPYAKKPETENASTAESASEQAEMSLDEYLKQGGQEWFLTGKKEHSVQAMMISKETSFHNELEAADYTVTDDGVTVILKGAFDEMWTSELPNVIAAYVKSGGSELTAEDFAVKDKYIEIVAKPAPDAYYAMYVPLNVSVTIETAGRNVLHTNLPNAPHGDGDYLVCRKDQKGEPDLTDVWILNGKVFPEYYSINTSK